MRIGVFGGSFNPVHEGHLAVAKAAVEAGLVEKVLMVLSPLNPLKTKPKELLPDQTRLEMLQLACAATPALEACDIELTMPRPSYTIDTLRKLAELYPADRFRLIIGGDNFEIFAKWKDYQEIIERFSPIVYPREGYRMPAATDPDFTPLEAPLFPLSSTGIRELLKEGKEADGLIPAEVSAYIRSHNLYTARGVM